jgi:hypothetical protein
MVIGRQVSSTLDKPISDRTGELLELVGIENAAQRMSYYLDFARVGGIHMQGT